jgi:hypothetical protein
MNIGYARVSTMDQRSRPYLRGIAEFERDLIGDRTSARRMAARRGIHLACPRSLPPSMQKGVRRLLDERKPSERLLTPLSSTPQPSVSSQLRRLKCIFCSVTSGYTLIPFRCYSNPLSSCSATRS